VKVGHCQAPNARTPDQISDQGFLLFEMLNRTTNMTPTLSKGFYRHYKGRYYEVLDLVRHSETEEWLVLYRTCYGDESRWVRPFTMFTETITSENVVQARFAYVGSTLPVDAHTA